MDPGRLRRVAEELAQRSGPPVLDRFLELCIELLTMSGAGIGIIRDGQHLGAIATAGASTAAVDELQFSLGEGPCIDADRAGHPIFEPDLTLAASYWPAFATAALGYGTRAVFAFPLRVGAVRLGVLNLYRDTSGDLVGDDLRDAMTLSRVATHVLLDLEAGTAPGSLPAHLAEVIEHRAAVHQATGMIAAQIEETVAIALSRLRAFAWSNDRTIDDVAADVVDRRLRFDD